MKTLKTVRDARKQATFNAKTAGLKRAEVRNGEREADAVRSTARIKDFSGRRP